MWAEWSLTSNLNELSSAGVSGLSHHHVRKLLTKGQWLLIIQVHIQVSTPREKKIWEKKNLFTLSNAKCSDYINKFLKV